MNNQYSTLLQAVEALQKRGYTHNFQVLKKGVLKEESGKEFESEDMELHEFHRFEGMTNPSDSSILYALTTNTGLKGTIADAYGADSNSAVNDFMKKIKLKKEVS